MPRETLKKQMEQLHEELASVPSVDEETGSALRQVLGDIQNLLDRSEKSDEAQPGSPEKHSIGDRLTDAARGLEASHPKAFSLIREIADTLAQAGI